MSTEIADQALPAPVGAMLCGIGFQLQRRAPVRASEEPSPTQPFPLAPPPLVPQRLTADDAWGPTPEDRNACRAGMEKLRSEGIFTPPSVAGTIAFPGNLGGMNWGSGAFDPERQTFVANVNIFAVERAARNHRRPRSEPRSRHSRHTKSGRADYHRRRPRLYHRGNGQLFARV